MINRQLEFLNDRRDEYLSAYNPRDEKTKNYPLYAFEYGIFVSRSKRMLEAYSLFGDISEHDY